MRVSVHLDKRLAFIKIKKFSHQDETATLIKMKSKKRGVKNKGHHINNIIPGRIFLCRRILMDKDFIRAVN